MRTPVLGIDVAAATLECLLLRDAHPPTRYPAANTPAGRHRLCRWVATQVPDLSTLTVCVEATGGYDAAIADLFHAAGATVARVNPARVRYWGLAEGVLTKTDPVDARTIAEFAQRTKTLRAWTPPPPWQVELRGLVHTRTALLATRIAYGNRQHTPQQTGAGQATCAHLVATLRTELHAMDTAIHAVAQTAVGDAYRLGQTLIGFGRHTVALLLAEFGPITQYASGRQLAALAGLAVRQHDSGTSVHGQPRITKQGSARVRQALYWPAITAIRRDPTLAAFAARLAARGKASKQIICAVMRKLLERYYAVLTSGQPYDPAYRSPLAAAPSAD